MCDVHLIEHSRERVTVVGSPPSLCSYCNHPLCGPAIRIVGALDDGTPGEFVGTYHVDCEEEMRDDVGESGCFTYGKVEPC